MSKILMAVAVVVIAALAIGGYMFLYPGAPSYTVPATGGTTGSDLTSINSDAAVSAATDAANAATGSASEISSADNLSVPDVNGN